MVCIVVVGVSDGVVDCLKADAWMVSRAQEREAQLPTTPSLVLVSSAACLGSPPQWLQIGASISIFVHCAFMICLTF
jgi:hypothetical protein